jgi:integrase
LIQAILAMINSERPLLADSRRLAASKCSSLFNQGRTYAITIKTRAPWNKGRLIGQKASLKLKEIWAIRIRLQLAQRTRDLALFNLAIDSKLRGCDLLALKVSDISQGSSILPRAVVMQQKTRRPVQFEITDQTRASLTDWIRKAQLSSAKYLFPSRDSTSPHLSTRQYARIVQS